ncbi:MAG: DNA polymerase III subunit delta [Anaerosomatales bacterium]|nr:DNA polymerase III subunit delta [Anaerosomatales bacterium]
MASNALAGLKPVYLIWGKEELLLEQAIARLRARVAEVADLDFNFEQFDGATAEAATVIAAANTLPFASDRRLVVVRDVDKMSADGQALLAQYALDPAETTVLVLVATTISRSSKLAKAIEALSGVSEYEAPRAREYPAWVVKHFGAKGRELDREAAEFLVRAVGKDLRRLDTEAEKVIAYAGERRQIGREDVEAVVAQTATASIFEYLDALGARQAATALRLLEELIADGESLFAIQGMTLRHLRSLISVRSLLDRGLSIREMMKVVRGAEWQVQNQVRQAQRYEEAELTGALRAAAQLEASLKTGVGDPRLLFERWVIETCERDGARGRG